MPEVDGITATERLREIAPHVSVTMLSIHGDGTTRVQAREAGADASVEKQTSVEDLLAEICWAKRRLSSGDRSPQHPKDTWSSDYAWYLGYIGDPASGDFRNPLVHMRFGEMVHHMEVTLVQEQGRWLIDDVKSWTEWIWKLALIEFSFTTSPLPVHNFFASMWHNDVKR